MVFRYKHIENLPPLAWHAKIKGGIVEVIHGSKVEVKENWFVEGAWSGEFGQGDFLEADWFCGTGARNCGDKIVFSTPTHVTYGLFFKNIGGEYRISNSLFFFMSKSDFNLDPQYLGYETDFNSITKGIERYNPHIHVIDRNGNDDNVDVYYFRHIAIDKNNRCEISKIKKVTPFADFENYYKRLIDDMRSLYSNAQDSNRKYCYGVVTMISKGYDAPCCAAVVKEIGGNTALTFSAIGKYAEDSGVDIAKKLGYQNIIEKDAVAYKNRADMPEIKYLCSGNLGDGISFSVFEEEYEGNLVFQGERGDSIYDRYSHHRNDEFHIINMQSGLSESEHRLWIGYIPVPMPLYGASAWPSLYDIANSDKMSEWQMNNNYDRPIPRRIVESAGVPREWFGIQKRGAGFSYHFDWMKRIVSRMSPKSGNDFSAYVRKHRKPYIIQKIRFFIKTYKVYLNRIGLKIKSDDIEQLSSTPNPMAARYLIPWAGEHILKQYKQILER